MGYFGKALMAPASYLPSQMTEVFTQGRAFAIAKLPNAGWLIFNCFRCVCFYVKVFYNIFIFNDIFFLFNILFFMHFDIGQRNICALTVINKLPRILVASADGYLYIYNLDPTDGQECPILRQFP